MCVKSDSLELLCFIKQLMYTNGDEKLHTGCHKDLTEHNY